MPQLFNKIVGDTPEQQAKIDEIMRRGEEERRQIARENLLANARIAGGAFLSGASALPFFNIPYIGTGIGGAMEGAGQAIMKGKSGKDIATDAGIGFAIGETVGAIPYAGKLAGKTNVGQAVAKKASGLYDKIMATDAGTKVANALDRDIAYYTTLPIKRKFYTSKIMNTSPFVRGASASAHNFIGESAFNINRADLNNAKLMKNQGYTPNEIFDKTGWFQGVDEKWRTEIPYGELNENPDLLKWQDVYVPEITEYSGKIGDIYNAPELYKNYPFIKDMDVYFKDTPENIGGYFDGNSITVDKKILPIKNPEYSQRIKELEATPEFEKYKPFLEDYNEVAEMEFLNSKVGEEWADLQFDSVENMPQFLQKGDPRKLKEVLTHELQHKIQDYENFARGTSANSPHYWSSAGEIEARKVGHRSNYPEHLLEEWKPFESHSLYDIAPEKQIVEFGDNLYNKIVQNDLKYFDNWVKIGGKDYKILNLPKKDYGKIMHIVDTYLKPEDMIGEIITKSDDMYKYTFQKTSPTEYKFIKRQKLK